MLTISTNVIEYYKSKLPTTSNIIISFEKKYVNPYFFMEKLSEQLSKDDVVITDDGAHLTWTIQALKVLKKQRKSLKNV